MEPRQRSWNAAHWSIDAVCNDAHAADMSSIEAQNEGSAPTTWCADGPPISDYEAVTDGDYTAQAEAEAGAQGR